ncbi:MAG: DNA polymerase III subunit gamma/tau [Polyangiaceae bacterium]|nr:DNA polymerase III subunit gamma/tau [Polyangiaceae bacterium]
MSYVVLARKYRPQSFADLVGQEHVATTLANAIESNRVAHAFLFTGVRGVGKTTSARLLAKSLNCLGKDGENKGPVAIPCQVCAACNEITLGNDMDVQEIDGASYNGVDEVRKLQEGLLFRPARDRYKIYIVDEVHMLSNAAWNAFLKTLEEPPPHVKFIFATTEVHKVPATILSRCQRYDFKLIPSSVIVSRLETVLNREECTAEPGALSILSKEAAGSMRDAMSLLDQVLAYSGKSLKEADVARVLGVADSAAMETLVEGILRGDAKNALSIVASLSEQGVDLVHFSKALLTRFRDLLVLRSTDDPALLDCTSDEITRFRALIKEFSTAELLRLFNGFSSQFDEIARGGFPKMSLEMVLVRLAHRPPLASFDELIARLEDLEKGTVSLEAGTPKSPEKKSLRS